VASACDDDPDEDTDASAASPCTASAGGGAGLLPPWLPWWKAHENGVALCSFGPWQVAIRQQKERETQRLMRDGLWMLTLSIPMSRSSFYRWATVDEWRHIICPEPRRVHGFLNAFAGLLLGIDVMVTASDEATCSMRFGTTQIVYTLQTKRTQHILRFSFSNQAGGVEVVLLHFPRGVGDLADADFSAGVCNKRAASKLVTSAWRNVTEWQLENERKDVAAIASALEDPKRITAVFRAGGAGDDRQTMAADQMWTGLAVAANTGAAAQAATNALCTLVASICAPPHASAAPMALLEVSREAPPIASAAPAVISPGGAMAAEAGAL